MPDSPRGQLGIRSGARAHTHSFHKTHPAHFSAGQRASLRPEETSQSAGSDTSRDRKRQLECDRVAHVKRARKEAHEEFDSSADQSSFSVRPAWSTRLRHARGLPVCDPDSSRCPVRSAPGGLLSYAGAEIYTNPTASWEQLWPLTARHVPGGHPVTTCRALRRAEALSGFFLPPLCTPLSLGVQETSHLTGGDFLYAHQETFHHSRSQLHHPGFVLTSCLRP